MRQETIVKTYLKFDELTEVQKKKVLNKMRDINVNYNWSEFSTDDFKHDLESLGFTNVKIYWSGFSSQGDGASFTATKGEDIIEKSRTLRYEHAYTMQCENKKLLAECIDLANAFYKKLEKEYDYLMSDEAVKETIEANDYEFDSETLELV